MAGSALGEDAAIAPASAKADEAGTPEVKEERRRRKKKPEACSVFESVPVVSTADARHGVGAGCVAAARAEIESALEQAESAITFESQPRSSRTDSGANMAGGQRGSHVAAARALIEAACDISEQACVFESMPRQSTADAAACGDRSAARRDNGHSGSSVFESAPAPSRADVLHGDGLRHAEAAEATITRAAEQADAQAGVFESKPQVSKADALSGAAGGQVRAARALIERAADGVAGGRVSGVFESQPAKSTASVGYGRAAESSSGEEETDDEEEEEDEAERR